MIVVSVTSRFFFKSFISKDQEVENGFFAEVTFHLKDFFDFSGYFSIARILRGIRIAARLDFKFTKETALAIRDFASTVLRLDKVQSLTFPFDQNKLL